MAGLLLVAEIADKEMDMEKQIRLLHSTHKSNIDQMLRNGLKATSSFDDLDLEMRRGVVYCWLKKEHDKMWGQRADYVYVQVTVDKNRCRVADMDFISIAMMYLQGSKGKPKNEEAAQLLADLYRITSVPLSEYTEGMFWTPEVLVKGDIDPDCIRLISET
jgi:predicted RNA-binding protein (virulence factor B family)